MKLRTIVKIAITSSVVLLCAGFALYSFFRLSAAEGKKDFNLYELVPPSASACRARWAKARPSGSLQRIQSKTTLSVIVSE